MNPTVQPNEILMREAEELLRALKTAPGDEVSRQADEWLCRSPAHLRCFLQVSTQDELLRRIGFEKQHTENEWIAMGLRDSGDMDDLDQIDEIEEREATSREAPMFRPPGVAHAPSPHSWGRHLFAAGAFAAMGLVVLFCWWHWLSWQDYVFDELPASTHPIVLADRSKVLPYSSAEMRVRYVPTSRDVVLLQTGARFEVARDPERPFRVRAGAATIEAVGTAFNVLMKNGRTGVHVSEGAVRISANGKTLHLQEGDSAEALEDGTLVLIPPHAPAVSVESRDYGTEFGETTLGEMALALNRMYRVPQLEVVGAANERRVIAPKNLDDPRKWVRVLSKYDELQVEERGTVAVVRLRAL